jgi:hypothetical protein
MWRLVNDDERGSSTTVRFGVDVALPGFTCPPPAQ